MFDTEKLAWVNRHYLRDADADRLAVLTIPYLQRAGWAWTPDADGTSYLARVVPLATGSVDRLEQVPARLRFLFDYSAERALADPALRQEVLTPAARAVIDALASELAREGRLLDRETFRAAAARVREATAQKGRALFHPIRIALTGEGEGMELDLAVPAIEAGASLSVSSGIRQIIGARERATAFAQQILVHG